MKPAISVQVFDNHKYIAAHRRSISGEFNHQYLGERKLTRGNTAPAGQVTLHCKRCSNYFASTNKSGNVITATVVVAP